MSLLRQSASPTSPAGRFKVNLISSEHIDNAAVFDPCGKEIGQIDHLMIDMASGRLLYAVVDFCGFVCLHPGHHPMPWNALKVDKGRRGYVTDASQELVESSPGYSDESWMDREWETRVHQHYHAEPYLREGGAKATTQ